MFIYESHFTYFLVLALLTSGLTMIRVVGSTISFLKLYLISLALIALINPSLFFLLSFISDQIYQKPLNSIYADLFFAGDFLFLLLLGGVIATRYSNILKRHIYFSSISTLILISSLFVFSLNESNSFRHIVISLCLLVLLLTIVFELIKSLSRLFYGRTTLFNLLILSIISACFWLVMFFLIISFESIDMMPYPMAQNLLNIWLILKSLFLFLLLYFMDFTDEEEKQIFSEILVRKANERTEKMTLASISLFKLPYPVLVISNDGNIEFANSACTKLLASGDLNGKNINSVFLTFEPSSSISSICSLKLDDKSLRMFKINYYNIDFKKSKNKLCCLENIDFNFSDFCQGVVASGNNSSNKIMGILDHNFAIYRMSSEWTKLLNPIDKFFHSGIIWDKLKILSFDKREIFHLENSIDSSSESSAWLNLRSGSSIKVSIIKLYAPDFRHFYLFSADIVDKRIDENHLTNYSKGHSYNSL